MSPKIQSEPASVTDLTRLNDRLRHVSRPYSARQLAEMTGHHPERVRRYLRGETPCVTFLLAVCEVLGLSADWLLCGRGPVVAAARDRQSLLLQATLPELLDALAWRWLRQPAPDGLPGLRAAIAGLEPAAASGPMPPLTILRSAPRQGRPNSSSNGSRPVDR